MADAGGGGRGVALFRSGAELLTTGRCIADFLLKLYLHIQSDAWIDCVTSHWGDVVIVVSPAPIRKEHVFFNCKERKKKRKKSQKFVLSNKMWIQSRNLQRRSINKPLLVENNRQLGELFT